MLYYKAACGRNSMTQQWSVDIIQSQRFTPTYLMPHTTVTLLHIYSTLWINKRGGGFSRCTECEILSGGAGACIYSSADAVRLILSNFYLIFNNIYLICAMPFVCVINFWLSEGVRCQGGGSAPFPHLGETHTHTHTHTASYTPYAMHVARNITRLHNYLHSHTTLQHSLASWSIGIHTLYAYDLGMNNNVSLNHTIGQKVTFSYGWGVMCVVGHSQIMPY